MRRLLIMLAAFGALLALASCSQATPQPPPPAPTKTPRPTFTPTVVVTIPPIVTPAPLAPATQPAPAATVAPTAAPAAAQPTAAPTVAPTAAAASLSASQNVNVRGGPGTLYPVVGQLRQGQGGKITGKNASGEWLQFDYSGQTGWVTAELVNVSGDMNAISVAQNIPAPPPTAIPPTPRPTARPQPTSPPAPVAPPAPQYPFQLLKGSGQCESNPGSSYVNGFVRYKSNAARNGVCVHIAFYGPRNTKCSGCEGVGDGQWGFSPFGGPAPAGTTVEVFIVECPGQLPLGGQTQTSGFGNLTPQSDKWVHTFAQSEQCTGVTFVGD